MSRIRIRLVLLGTAVLAATGGAAVSAGPARATCTDGSNQNFTLTAQS